MPILDNSMQSGLSGLRQDCNLGLPQRTASINAKCTGALLTASDNDTGWPDSMQMPSLTKRLASCPPVQLHC